MQIALIIALIFSIIIAIFAVQNTQSVAVTFLTFQTQELSVSIVVLASAAVGALLTFFFGLWRQLRSSLTLRSDRKKIEQLDSSLAELQRSYAQAQEKLKQLQQENEQLKSRLSSASTAPSAAAQSAGSPLGKTPAEPGTSGQSGPAPTLA